MTYLGLDVGGTHCRFEWWPEGCHPGGDARAVQPAVHGIEATVAGLAEAIAAAARTAAPAAIVCALAGVGDAATGAAIARGLLARGIAAPTAIVGDVLAAAAAALRDGPGVLVWAGTGSFAVARSAAGDLVRVGGRGYLLGDQGSGYDLVRRAAAAVLLAADGLGPPTALTDALAAAFEAPAPQRLGAVLQRLDSGQVAARVPVVLAAAAAGDAVAADVIEAGADALAMLAAAAARHAGLDLRGVEAAFGGGMLINASACAGALDERLRRLGAMGHRLVPARAAAHGAAWLAQGWHEGLEPQRGWVQRVAL